MIHYNKVNLDKISRIIEDAYNDIPDKCRILEIPAAFDTETTSVYVGEEKFAFMYLWQLGFRTKSGKDYILYGRNWEQYEVITSHIKKTIRTMNAKASKCMRLIIYVHNLSYDFQFMRGYINFEDVFALDTRKVLKASDEEIEYRCSYKMTGYSLAKLGENLKNPVKKLKGFLDYEKVRHEHTPLTQNELKYGEHDIKVLLQAISETSEECGGISKIPLTVTGFVRQYMKKECFGKNRKKYQNYKSEISMLRLELEEYNMLRRAFQGGFVHANAHYVGKTIESVRSYDKTSDYPSQLVYEYFPMGKASKVEITENTDVNFIYKLLDNYCCLFDVTFDKVEQKFMPESYWSSSKTTSGKKVEVNNGRIVSAEMITTTMTELDFKTFINAYHVGTITFGTFYVYHKGKLPKSIVKGILKLYKNKTELKGVEDKYVEYMRSKGMMNSVYGMMVTAVIRDEIAYESGTWISPKHPDGQKEIDKYNDNNGRFLFYPWGVWTTAHARHELWEAIFAMGEDHRYSDTDAEKFVGEHSEYFLNKNKEIMEKAKTSSKYYNIPIEDFMPENNKGKKFLLGTWDDEGTYDKFKTLGAKRYMVEKKGKIGVTVSGSNPKGTADYLNAVKSHYRIDPFDMFEDELEIPSEYSGRVTMKHIDTPATAVITDYTGRKCVVHSRGWVHAEKSEYTFDIKDDFQRFIKKIQNGERL